MRKSLLFLGVVTLLFSSISFGQTTFGRITGTVEDTSNAAVPKAPVTLTNLGTQEKRSAVTDSVGNYEFVNLVPGQYQLDVEMPGFVHVTRGPVVVEVQQTTTINLVLQLGAVSQTIEVTGQTPLLQSETSSLGQVIETRQVNELPLNGRNAMNLTALSPSVVPQGQSQGTVTGANPFAWGNYQIGGAVTNQGAEYLDGVPLNNSYANLLSLIPTQDSIQEFKVQTNNLDAEWGRFAGGVINFTTKTGTNSLHGAAYEYLRNTVLNANDWFDNATSVPRAPFVQNQFGANAGGPFVIPHLYDGRGKTFWFASYEGFRQRYGTPWETTVPTAAERGGDFSSLLTSLGPVSGQLYDPLTTVTATGARTPFQGNIIPANRINPTTAAMMTFLPMPNIPGLTDQSAVNNWSGTASEGGDNDQFVTRVDQNVSDKQRIFVRYTYWTNLNLPIDPFDTGICKDRCTEKFNTHDAIFDDVYSFNPTTILNMRITFNRFKYDRIPKTAGIDLSQFGPNWPAYGTEALQANLPIPCLTNQYDNDYIECSQGAGSVIFAREDTERIAGSLTKIKGRHTIQFGGEYRIDTHNYAQTNAPIGMFNFSSGFTSSNFTSGLGGDSAASMLLGYSSGIGSQGNPVEIASLQIYPALYLQDQFRATSKLTLNYGIRWEQTGPYTERYNRLTVLDPNIATAVTAGCSTLPAADAAALGEASLCMPNVGDFGLVKTPQNPNRYSMIKPWKQFSPHVGFAYQFGPKTVIRGGYGLFWISPAVEFQTSPNNDFVNNIGTPMITSVDGGRTPCMTPSAAGGCSPGSDGGLSETYNMTDPYPDGILHSPGRNPIYQTLMYGNGDTADYPKNPPAYYQQWNFDVQRELPEGTLIDVSYAAAKGVHLPDYSQQLDVLPDKYLSLGNHLLDQVPNPYYGLFQTGNPAIQNLTSLNASPTVQLQELLLPYPQYTGYSIGASDWAGSSYNSLQVKLEKRMRGSGTLLVAYTISKMVTTGDVDSLTSWLESSSAGPGGIQDWNDRANEKSLSSYDVPQRFVASYVLDLPVGQGKRYLRSTGGVAGKLISGWGAQGITTYQSGFPLNINGGGTAIGWGNSQRPTKISLASGKTSGSADSRLGGAYGPNTWFDTSVFGYTSPWTYGNESRINPVLRGQGIQNWDFALVKNTAFGPEDKLNLQFRAEFFNIFNKVQFNAPNTGCCSNPNEPSYNSAFGTVTSDVNSPRLIQFGLRLTF